jgi:hypothetical protein
MDIIETAYIYKLRCKLLNICYIGSTKKTLKQRSNEHKGAYNYFMKHKKGVLTSSYKIIENNNYEILELEKCINITKKDLLTKEKYYIQNTENVVNKNIPIIEKEEKKARVKMLLEKTKLPDYKKFNAYKLDYKFDLEELQNANSKCKNLQK